MKHVRQSAQQRPWQTKWHDGYIRWRLFGFARVLFWSDKFQQRFSPVGMGLWAGLVLTMVFGLNTKQSMIYQMFSLLFALLILAILFNIGLALRRHKQFTASRILPNFATVNVPLSYTVTLHNHGKYDVYGLRVVERMPPVMPSLAHFLAAHEPQEEQRNWYDRKTGFYRFMWLQHWFHGAKHDAKVLDKLKAKQCYELKLLITPMRRGVMHFSCLRLAVTEPLGLMYYFTQHQQYQSLLVLPKRYAIPQHLSLSGGRKYQQGGVSQASTVGDAEEFHGLREYRAGDSPRHIHWASLARGGKPLVKEYQDEHFTRQALVLDSFGDDGLKQLFEEAVSLAAGFASGVEFEDKLLDLLFIHAEGEDVEQLTAGRALAHPEQMLQALASIELSPPAAFQQLADAVLRQAESFGACVFIVMTWDSQRQDFVRQLLAQGLEVRLFWLLKQDSAAENASFLGLEGRFHCLRAGSVQQDLANIAAEI